MRRQHNSYSHVYPETREYHRSEYRTDCIREYAIAANNRAKRRRDSKLFHAPSNRALYYDEEYAFAFYG